MHFANQSILLLDEPDVEKKIEICGRIAWQTPMGNTPSEFVSKLVRLGHTSVLEHAYTSVELPTRIIDKLPLQNSYLIRHGRTIIGNIRAWYNLFRNNIPTTEMRVLESWLHEHVSATVFKHFDLRESSGYLIEQPLTEPFAHYTFILKTDRGITHELVRHRVLSFIQESTRWVKYTDMEFIAYYGFPKPKEAELLALEAIERAYRGMLEENVSPSCARRILPNCTSAMIAVSGFAPQWTN